jgi:hypothetical protein
MGFEHGVVTLGLRGALRNLIQIKTDLAQIVLEYQRLR